MTEPTNHARPWTAEEEALLRKHTEQGLGRAESARRLGRKLRGIMMKAHRMRLGRPAAGSKGTAWPTDKLREAAKLLDAGLSYRAIRSLLGGGSIGGLHAGLARMKKRAARISDKERGA